MTGWPAAVVSVSENYGGPVVKNDKNLTVTDKSQKMVAH